MIRVYEAKQCRSRDVKLILGKKIRKAVECNLIELEEQPVHFDAQTITFDITPYEIRTFKVWLE